MRSPWNILPLVFVTVLSISACNDSGDTVLNTPLPGTSPTTYHYSAYTMDGMLVIVGTITLAVKSGSTVSGTWKLLSVAPGELVGPQTGSGTLTGSLEGSRVMINLNPGWADNNVFLTGTFDGDRIAGAWMWSTFVGPTSQGTFQAQKT